MTIDVTQIFIYFFAVIDPIGTLPVFLAVTAGNTAAEKRRIALMAFAVSCAVLVFFIVAGELILNAMHNFSHSYKFRLDTTSKIKCS